MLGYFYISAAVEKKPDKSLRRVVPLGEKVLLECPLGFNGNTNDNRAVFWLWNDAEIMLNDNVEVDAKKGSLLILKVGLANEGSYTCGVRGSGGGKDHVSSRLGETVIIDVRGKCQYFTVIYEYARHMYAGYY